MVMKLFMSSIFLFFSFSALATGPMTPSQYMNINGLSVAVYESAGTEGPGILLIHGNTSSANAFAKLFGEFHQLVIFVVIHERTH